MSIKLQRESFAYMAVGKGREPGAEAYAECASITSGDKAGLAQKRFADSRSIVGIEIARQ